ncbi:hypothetical protein QFC19_003375 [Naganishia cerealis]|uniref:Uncharacterized protein n=1 Tax=Naganishia cerealis TaxID=610337 RepID=A0ACC2W3Z2_9TREE|nr:hypothetical protein QFC19_003375 [Naganishia cerealis]
MSSSESEYDPREALDEIDRDIEALEATLRPLLDSESSWRETLDSLGNMEQAKMNMIMAYGICDLVWKTTSATAESSSPSTPTPPLEEDYQVGKSSRFKIAHDALPEKLQTDIRHDQMQVVDDDMSADVPAAAAAAAADETGETNKAATASKHKGKRVAAEDFLDEETPKKTMSPGVTAGGDKTRKKRKSTSKRS